MVAGTLSVQLLLSSARPNVKPQASLLKRDRGGGTWEIFVGGFLMFGSLLGNLTQGSCFGFYKPAGEV